MYNKNAIQDHCKENQNIHYTSLQHKRCEGVDYFFLVIISAIVTVKQKLHSLLECLVIILHGPILRHD